MKRADIKKVFSRLGCDSFKDSEGWVQMSCPFARWNHDGGIDKNPSFGVKVQQGVSGCNCFACGVHGGVLSILNQYKGKLIENNESEEEIEKVESLKDFVFMVEDEPVSEDGVGGIAPRPFKKEWVESLGSGFDKTDFFEKNGITKELFDEWNLGLSKEDKRVLFPVYDIEGELIGIGGRTLIKEEPKYRNEPSGGKIKNYLYGEHLIDSRDLVIVEGPTDTLVVHKYLKNRDVSVCGTLGTKFTQKQVNKVLDYADRVTILYDYDSYGLKAMVKLAEKLKRKLPVLVVDWDVLKDKYGSEIVGKDPGDLTRDEFDLIFDSREYWLEVLLKGYIKKGYKSKILNLRKRVVKNI